MSDDYTPEQIEADLAELGYSSVTYEANLSAFKWVPDVDQIAQRHKHCEQFLQSLLDKDAPATHDELARLVALHDHCGLDANLRKFESDPAIGPGDDIVDVLQNLRTSRKQGIKKLLESDRPIKLTGTETDQMLELHHTRKLKVRLLLELYGVEFDPRFDNAQPLWELVLAMAGEKFKGFAPQKTGGAPQEYKGFPGLKFYATVRAKERQTGESRKVVLRAMAEDDPTLSVDEKINREEALTRGFVEATKSARQAHQEHIKKYPGVTFEEFENKLRFHLEWEPQIFDVFDADKVSRRDCPFTGLGFGKNFKNYVGELPD